MTENVETHIKALYESVGRGFESLPSHQTMKIRTFFPIGEGFGFFVFFGKQNAAVAQQ